MHTRRAVGKCLDSLERLPSVSTHIHYEWTLGRHLGQAGEILIMHTSAESLD